MKSLLKQVGKHPIGTMLKGMGPTVAASLPPNTLNVLEGQTFFPNAIASPFMTALAQAFVIGAILCFVALFSQRLGAKNTFTRKKKFTKNKRECKDLRSCLFAAFFPH